MKTIKNYFEVSPKQATTPPLKSTPNDNKRNNLKKTKGRKAKHCLENEFEEEVKDKNDSKNAFEFMMENRNKTNEIESISPKQKRNGVQGNSLIEIDKSASKRKRASIKADKAINALKENKNSVKSSDKINESNSKNSDLVEENTQNGNASFEKRVLRPRPPKKPTILVVSDDSDEDEIKLKQKRKKTKTISSGDVEVVKIEENKRKTNKIAPVFLKANNQKLKEDPLVVKARREFLLSEIPPDLKKEKAIKCASFDEETTFDVFPLISHIQQRNGESFWDLPAVNNFNYYQEINEISTHSNIFNICFKDEKQERFSIYESVTNVKDIVQLIKNDNSNYPVYKSFKMLKKRNLDKAKNLLWSEKYRANNSDEIFGNKTAVTTLKNWLQRWLDGRQKNDSNSDSDFDDGSSETSRKNVENVVILSGPCGCGKSSTVYALCNELGLNVLEMNASSKRTGKKLLQELQEATQSHQMEKSNDNDGSQKICVLLVEDVDIVFDQDEGFISALSQLIPVSKRPIILTTTDDNLNTQKMLNYKKIPFYPISGKILNVWLQLVCLIENKIYISKNMVEEVLNSNRGDIRKTLLQLQFWGNLQFPLDNCFNIDSLWWSLSNVLNNNQREERLGKLGLNLDENVIVNDEQFSLKDISQILDRISVLDRFRGKNSDKKCKSTKNNLNLLPNLDDYSQNDEIFEELSKFLIKSDFKQYSSMPQIENKWLNKLEKCNKLFNLNLPLCESIKYDKIGIDYLPLYRSIARIELNKLTTNTKRTKRFYNYLNNFGVNCNDTDWKLVCKILQ